jgi:hypothetical protein
LVFWYNIASSHFFLACATPACIVNISIIIHSAQIQSCFWFIASQGPGSFDSLSSSLVLSDDFSFSLEMPSGILSQKPFYHLFSVLFAIMVFKFIQGIKGAAAFFTSILITHCWRRRRHIYVYYCWYRRIDLKTNVLHNQLLLLLWSLFGCEFWFIKVARSKR